MERSSLWREGREGRIVRVVMRGGHDERHPSSGKNKKKKRREGDEGREEDVGELEAERRRLVLIFPSSPAETLVPPSPTRLVFPPFLPHSSPLFSSFSPSYSPPMQTSKPQPNTSLRFFRPISSFSFIENRQLRQQDVVFETFLFRAHLPLSRARRREKGHAE